MKNNTLVPTEKYELGPNNPNKTRNTRRGKPTNCYKSNSGNGKTYLKDVEKCLPGKFLTKYNGRGVPRLRIKGVAGIHMWLLYPGCTNGRDGRSALCDGLHGVRRRDSPSPDKRPWRMGCTVLAITSSHHGDLGQSASSIPGGLGGGDDDMVKGDIVVIKTDGELA